MFCKYCGADTPNGAATKCARCGKPLDAKSDCGGYYDLVHVTPKTPTAAPTAAPAAPVVHYAAPPKSKLPLILLIMLAILFAVVVVLSLQLGIMAGHMKTQAEQINALASKVEALHKEPEAPADPDPEQTEPMFPDWKEEESPKDRFDFEATIDKESGPRFTATLTPTGEGAQPVTAELTEEQVTQIIGIDDLTGALASLNISVDGTDADLVLKVENTKAQEAENKCLLTVTVESLSQEVFGELAEGGAIAYTWQYRTLKEGEEAGQWQDITEETELFSVLEGGNSLSYNAKDMKKELEQLAGLELRLVLTRENTAGGSLTVTVNKLAITQALVDALQGE